MNPNNILINKHYFIILFNICLKKTNIIFPIYKIKQKSKIKLNKYIPKDLLFFIFKIF